MVLLCCLPCGCAAVDKCRLLIFQTFVSFIPAIFVVGTLGRRGAHFYLRLFLRQFKWCKKILLDLISKFLDEMFRCPFTLPSCLIMYAIEKFWCCELAGSTAVMTTGLLVFTVQNGVIFPAARNMTPFCTVNTDKPIVITAVLPASSQRQNYFCMSIGPLWSSSYYSLIGFDGSDELFDLLLLIHFYLIP